MSAMHVKGHHAQASCVKRKLKSRSHDGASRHIALYVNVEPWCRKLAARDIAERPLDGSPEDRPVDPISHVTKWFD